MALDMKTGKLADIASLDYVNILTPDINRCRKIYVDALGLKEGFRPDFCFPGLWLYLEGAPVLYFIETDESLPEDSGIIDQIAFCAHNFEKFTARLAANGFNYEDQEIPGMDLHQLFCFVPHGIKVEFNFEGQDRPWKTLEQEHNTLKQSSKKKRLRNRNYV